MMRLAATILLVWLGATGAAFHKALAADGANRLSIANRGDGHDLLMRYAEAMSDFRRAIGPGLRSANTVHVGGAIHFRNRDDAAADADLLAALDLNSRLAPSQTLRAALSVRAGDPDGMLDAADRAPGLRPDNIFALNVGVHALERLERLAEAIALLRIPGDASARACAHSQELAKRRRPPRAISLWSSSSSIPGICCTSSGVPGLSTVPGMPIPAGVEVIRLLSTSVMSTPFGCLNIGRGAVTNTKPDGGESHQPEPGNGTGVWAEADPDMAAIRATTRRAM